MRRVPPLCFLACSLALLGTSPSHAAVYSNGLAAVLHGNVVIGSTTDEQTLHCTQFGASGGDGVDIPLLRAESHQLTCMSGWTPASAGARLTFHWTLVARPGGSTARSATLQVSATPGGSAVSCDLSPLSSSPTAIRLLYRGDVLVASVDVPSSSSFETQVPLPVITIEPRDIDLDLHSASHRAACSFHCASAFVYVAGGASLLVDRVVTVIDRDLDDDGVLDVCSVRLSNPVGGDFTSFDIIGQRTGRSGHSMTALGTARFKSADDLWGLEHIGPDGLDGVSVSQGLFHALCGDGSCSSYASPHFADTWPHDGDLDLVLSRLSPWTMSTLDEGASLLYRVTGSGSCSPDGVLASLETAMHLGQCTVRSHFSGMCADQESVIVLNSRDRTYTGGRFQLDIDGVVTVSPPPNGSTDMAISRKGAPATRSRGNSPSQTPQPAPGNPPRVPAFTAISAADGLTLHVGFADVRRFCINGVCVDGDELVFTGRAVSGGVGALVSPSGASFVFRSSSVTGEPSSVLVQDVHDAGTDQVFAEVGPSAGLSSAYPVLDIPVRIRRVDAHLVRGYSVTLHMSSNLAFAGPIREFDYLSRSGDTQFLVTHNADGSHTVDCAILGPGCGPSDDGTLFSIPVSALVPPGTGLGTLSIDAVELADCAGGPVTTSPGGSVAVPIDFIAPATPSGVTASQLTSGNDGDGTSKILVHLDPLEAGASLEVYRARFGNYPGYDNGPAPGSVPTFPSDPPTAAAGWQKVDNTSCAAVAPAFTELCDEPSSRDTYYFVLAARDRYDNRSGLSDMTNGVTNYFHGDFSNGLAVCAGDNQVTTADVSALASHYGATYQDGSPLECFDIAPTADGKLSGRPLTDHRLSFPDLISLSIAFSLVSAPADVARPTAAAMNALSLRFPPLPAVGQTFDVVLELSGAGDALGVSTQLGYDAAVVEPLAVTRGELMGRQGRDGVVLSAQPGNVDAALLGVGAGLAGEGELARVTFRVKAEGDPALGIASAEARDTQNRLISFSGVGLPAAGPAHTALRMAFPNPFDRSTTVVLSLAKGGPASVRVFDVAGRTVRTLLNGVQPAGERQLAWDGRDDAGTLLGAGVYMLRLEAGGHAETRALRLVR